MLRERRPMTDQPISNKSLLESDIKLTAEQLKTKGKPIAEALVAAGKENARFEQNGCVPLTDSELKSIVNAVYGQTQRAVISTSRDFAAKEFKESEVMLEVKETHSPVLHHPSLGEIHAFRGVGKTNFGIGLFDALATGGEFLCYKATRPFKTIYFDGEMDASDLQEALSILAEENDNFTLVARCEQPDNFMPSIATAEGLAWCEEAIARAGAEVAIFDNWSTLLGAGHRLLRARINHRLHWRNHLVGTCFTGLMMSTRNTYIRPRTGTPALRHVHGWSLPALTTQLCIAYHRILGAYGKETSIT